MKMASKTKEDSLFFADLQDVTDNNEVIFYVNFKKHTHAQKKKQQKKKTPNKTKNPNK